MSQAEPWSLGASVMLFVLAAVLITVFGVRMTRVAGRLAQRTGFGEAVMGALFVGASTSLAEIVTSSAAAVEGYPALAVSNALGSIAGQTAFLAVVDMGYRKANLEHAAASAENLMLGAFLLTLLAVLVLAAVMPAVELWAVHPASLALFVAYVYGIRLVSQTHKMPMWQPRRTRDTAAKDRTDAIPPGETLVGLWLRFALAAAFVAFAGWLLAHAAIGISARTGLSETAVGGLFTGLSSSLPEFVTALTAVRMGALTLAVGDVLGGNAFDTLIVAVADVLYRDGSVYAAVSEWELFLISLTMLMTGILLMGLLHRERHGIGNIGLESVLILALYIGAFTALLTGS